MRAHDQHEHDEHAARPGPRAVRIGFTFSAGLTAGGPARRRARCGRWTSPRLSRPTGWFRRSASDGVHARRPEPPRADLGVDRPDQPVADDVVVGIVRVVLDRPAAWRHPATALRIASAGITTNASSWPRRIRSESSRTSAAPSRSPAGDGSSRGRTALPLASTACSLYALAARSIAG